MAVAIASVFLSSGPGLAQASGPNAPTFLLFGGTALSRYSAFLYGGALWSPAGVDADGFTLKALLNGGDYTYTPGDLQTEVRGTMLSAAVMPGWRFSTDGLVVRLFAGPVVQDYPA